MIVGLIVLVAASTTEAQPPAPPLESVSNVAAPWKIAGVELGMRPSKVGVALREAGYKLTYRYEGPSWQSQVESRGSSQSGVRVPAGAKVVEKEDYQRGQEEIRVWYRAGRLGPYVSGIDYAISSEAIDAERFRSAALTKFGRPTLRWDWELLYCSAGERQCSRTGGLVTNQLPNLTVYAIHATKRYLHLRQGERADKAYDAAVRAEAERLYPKKDKPTF